MEVSEGRGIVTISTQVVSGLPDLSAASREASASSHYVLLTVSDTGHGIDEEHLKHVAGGPEWDSWDGPRDVPLEGSYCKHVVESGEARLRALIENGEDLNTILDADGQILYASPAYEQILGYDAKDLAGTSLEDLVHPSDSKRWTEKFFGGLAAPSDRASGEWRMRHRSGDWRVVDGSGVNLLHEPAVRGQVIMNLAVNARDAMPKGGTLRIETRDVTVRSEQAGSHSDIQPGRYVQLVVADDGVGMTRAVQNKLFDPFYTTKPRGKGTGLGLSIMWKVIKQLDGHIHVYSEPGRGTTFRIYFPWADGELAGKEVNTEVPEGNRFEVRKRTILIVENQPEVSRITEKILASEGHTVFACGSGELALELAGTLQEAPDLLLSDVLLPGITGPEAAWQLLERWPDLAVVFTAGYTQGELVNQEVELRAAGFLPKPFGQEELIDAVVQALRHKNGIREMPSDPVLRDCEENGR